MAFQTARCTCPEDGKLVFLGHAPACPERQARFETPERLVMQAIVNALAAAHHEGYVQCAEVAWNERAVTGIVESRRPGAAGGGRAAYHRFRLVLTEAASVSAPVLIPHDIYARGRAATR